jgi:hypothetical protein
MTFERLNRLRTMLQQVGSAEPLPTLESLEGRTAAGGPALDAQRARARDVEAEFALESLDVVRQGKEVDADQRFAL